MILTSQDISSIIEFHVELIWTTISKLSNRLNLDDEFMYDIIIQRLPDYLSRKEFREEKNILFLQTIIVQATKRIYEDVEDVILLQKKSSLLIVKYIPLIAAKVQYAVRTNYIKAHDSDDALQIIQQKLLEKLASGQLSSFKESEGNLFTTFLFKIVSNLIKDIAKSFYQTQKNQTKQEINDELTGDSTNQSNVLSSLIQNEKQTFLLKQFRYQILTYSLNIQHKLEICLKLNTRMLLSIQDAALLELNIYQCRDFVAIFGKSYINLSLGDLWKSICPFINIYEKKESSPDNHRKWYVRVRNQFVVKLLISSILKDRSDTDQQFILKKINSERTIAKLSEEWLYELVEVYYNKSDNEVHRP